MDERHLTDDDLARAWRGATSRGAKGAACPSADELFAVAMSEAEGDARARVVEHIAACSDCAEEYRLIPKGAPAARPVATFPGRPKWSIRPFALAASVFFALFLSVAVIRHGPPRDEEASVRGAEHHAVTVPLDRSTIASAPARIAWSPGEGAHSYRIVLYDDASTPVWESGKGAAPDVDVPEDARARLQAGRMYHWRVFMEIDGEERESPLFSFTIAP